ncbi:MAG: PD-(D/E)XK nuclease family protein [Myxococcota bacterium]
MIFVVFGRSRARRVAAIQQLAMAQEPAGVRPGWLVVVDAPQRPSDWVRALEGTTQGAILPETWAADALAAFLWRRFGDGRPWLGRTARELAARRWLRDHAHAYPSLARIRQGPELARHLASVDDALGQQRVVQMGDSELDTIVKALRQSHPAAFVRPAEATVRLMERLESPSPALRRWLAARPVLVLDDLLQPTPLRGAWLVSLARAASDAGSTVVVTLASGRDHGGREAGVLLGWDTADEALREASRVVAAQAPVRQALFGLVESGELEVICQTPDGGMAIEPWTEPGPPGPRDLADAYADGQPVPIVSPVQAQRWLGEGRVTLLRCSDPEDEATEAARAIQHALLDGIEPAQVVLAVADLARQRAVVEETLTAHGVPFTVPRPLIETPLGQIVLRLLDVGRPDPDPDRLCALADAVRVPLPLDPRRLRRWLLRAGLQPGAVETWRPGLTRWLTRNRMQTGGDPDDPEGPLSISFGGLKALHDAAMAIAADGRPHRLGRALLATLERLGAFTSDDVDRMQVQAAVVRTIETFATDLATIDPGPWPLEEIHEHIRDRFERTRVPGHADAVARVEVIDASEAIGRQAKLLWIMGLSRGHFPDRPPVAFLVQPSWRRRLARDPVTRARHGFAGWLRDTIDPVQAEVGGRIGRLVLSWPLTRGGRAVPPSAVLADLLDLPTSDGQLESIAVTTPERAARRRADGPASVVDTLDRAAAEAMARSGDDTPWRDALPPSVQDDFEVALRVERARQGPWGPYDGMLASPPRAPRTLSVTALEGYLKCPQRYWFDRVLRLSPPDAWAPELEPRRKGTALHSILEQFFERRGLRPVTGGDREALGRDLHAVACEVLDEIERQGGFDPAYQAYARQRWLAGLIDDAPAGILKAWLDLEIDADDGRRPVAVEAPFDDLEVGPVRIRGVLDRLDRLPDGSLIVTDYKTGTPPTRGSVAEGRSLQPYAYAEAASRKFPDAPVASTFLSLARPDRIARSGWVGDPGVLDQACGPGERRFALPVDARERRQVLQWAGDQARGLLAGTFVPTRIGPVKAGCRTCPHARSCRVDHARQAERVAAEEAAAAQGSGGES